MPTRKKLIFFIKLLRGIIQKLKTFFQRFFFINRA